MTDGKVWYLQAIQLRLIKRVLSSTFAHRLVLISEFCTLSCMDFWLRLARADWIKKTRESKKKCWQIGTPMVLSVLRNHFVAAWIGSCGGIGIRAWFRFMSTYVGAGSSPANCITVKKPEAVDISGIPAFSFSSRPAPDWGIYYKIGLVKPLF